MTNQQIDDMEQMRYLKEYRKRKEDRKAKRKKRIGEVLRKLRGN